MIAALTRRVNPLIGAELTPVSRVCTTESIGNGMEPVAAFEPGAMILGLVGGLALFLYGLDRLTEGLKHVAGYRMRTLFARMTSNRFKALSAGAAFTAVVQSSSVTTVLLVGFISAGLMSFEQSIGFIIGANIGSTVTAQIIAFRVTGFALVMVAVGVAFQMTGRRERSRNLGVMLLGLGLVFYGMSLMGDSAQPLRSWQPFVDAMRTMNTAGPAIIAGAVFTAVVQSSAATTGLVIVLGGQGLITLEAGILLVFGANIGTCVTALLAAMGKRREAVRAAVVHILLKVVGVLVWIAFVDDLAGWVRAFSPHHPELTGLARAAAEMPRQIANAHTIFNVANAALFIGFIGPIAWFVRRIVPERGEEDGHGVRPRYLDVSLLSTPALAVDRIRMEIRRLGEHALSMAERSLDTALDGDEEELETLARMDDDVDTLHAEVINYTRLLSRSQMPAALSRSLSAYVGAANHMESIGDMIETNIVSAGRRRMEQGVLPSEETRRMLQRMHDRVTWSVRTAFEALDANNPQIARTVIDLKPELVLLGEELERHLEDRLGAEGGGRVALFTLESELLEYYRRVYYFAKRVARLVESMNHEASRHDPE